MNQEKLPLIKQIFLNDRVILTLISINAVVIFFQGFKSDQWDQALTYADDIISLLFIIEVVVKSIHYGFREYLRSGWNKFDVILILMSIPSLVTHAIPGIEETVNVSFLLIFRVFRVFKFFRFIQFFPQVEHIFRSVQKAVSASFMVLVGFFVVIFIMAILSCFFFQDISPAYFGDPITAYYSTFQVFTVEGWNAIPDAIAKDGNLSGVQEFFMKAYFIALFIMGGIFGLSIVNSIFVDAMISDHDETEQQFAKVEESVEALNHKIERLLAVLEKNGINPNSDSEDKES